FRVLKIFMAPDGPIRPTSNRQLGSTRMLRLLALPLAVAAFHMSVGPLTPHVRAELNGHYWHKGCPVSLSQLRILTVSRWGFDGRVHRGQLIVNERVAAPLGKVFRQLYKLHFPIRHLGIDGTYGPASAQPADGDISGSFECRQAVPSPCVGGTGTGTWSEHPYGEAVGLNPVQDPHLGGRQNPHPASPPHFSPPPLPPP